MTRPIDHLDLPLPQLERNLVVASLDPFARMACEHPEACACDDDYPGWAERIAALAATNHHTPQEAK